MTHFWRSFAPSGARCALGLAALALGLAAGCGPGDGSDEYAEAEAAYAARNLQRAAEFFERSAVRDPQRVDALLMLTQVRIDLADFAGAREAWARASALAPDDADVIEFGAQLAWHERDYAAARAAYLRLAQDATLSVTNRAQAYTGLGVVDMAMGDVTAGANKPWLRDRARTEFLQAIALNPLCAAAHYHLGVLYRDAPFGYYDAALEQFQFYVRLAAEADKRMQHVQRSVIPGLKETIGTMLANRPGVASRDPAASAAALKRAEEAWKKGTYKTARLRYEEACKADPLSYPAAVGLAQAWEKSDATANGRQKAYEAYRAACQLRASAVKTFITAADLAVKLGQHASAVDLYSRAVAARAQDITAIDGLIRSLRRCGNAEAAAVYQRYRDTIPVKRR